VPLLLLDLDNTLVDRAAACRSWAQTFANALGGDVAQDDVLTRFMELDEWSWLDGCLSLPHR
jgi:beta-phosphoglucomutase-like phosphatase (HAD superfamily)